MSAIRKNRKTAFVVLAAVSLASGAFAVVAGEGHTSAAQQGQGTPAWAQRPLVSSSRAAVAKVVPTATADVVLLAGGHNEGFRDGMACEVYRGNELIAELMIVHCETERSAALITALKADMGIVPGDVANIKTVHPF